jgi:hypothetical protein
MDDLLTLKEFARACGVRTRRVLAWASSGVITVAHRADDASYFEYGDVLPSRERHAATIDTDKVVTWR